MILYNHMTPAHPHPQPRILANPQFAYTAINVATLFVEQDQHKFHTNNKM